MTYSYTQISHFLACPRRYRYRYLDGWQEREDRAAMLFGRAFEKALGAHFMKRDAAHVLTEEWTAVREQGIAYSAGDSWNEMLEQGHNLLEQFAREGRVRISEPQKNLQVKILRRLDERNDFVGFADAIGRLDGRRCLLDWKTSGSCYPVQPESLVALDPQLICYSWLTGVPEVALVVFVRKRVPEIQYLSATISGDQRQEFGRLVQDTVHRIEAAQFYPHSGIRFPQNQCTSCAFIGLCLRNEGLTQARLIRRTGAELGWLDELDY